LPNLTQQHTNLSTLHPGWICHYQIFQTAMEGINILLVKRSADSEMKMGFKLKYCLLKAAPTDKKSV